MNTERGPITVYGATGYTGQLVSAELASRGIPFIVAGRSEEKLAAVADSLDETGNRPEVRAVPNTDATRLKELFSRSSAVIACAGPFTLHGGPVIEAAAETGTPYLDTTGEQDFIRRAYEVWGPVAASHGSQVIPAMGFDYVPGDMLISLTADGLEEGSVDKVRVAYHAPFQPSRGTVRSGMEMIKGGDVEWRDRALRPASQAARRPDFDFGGKLGIQTMIHYPAGEHILVPSHLTVRSVESGLTAASFAPGAARHALPGLSRSLGLLMRTPLRIALSKAVSALPEGADEQGRTSADFAVACEVVTRDETRRGLLTGTDVYGITAAMITEGAIRASRAEARGIGALAPSTAFDPADFLSGLGRFKVKWEVGPAR